MRVVRILGALLLVLVLHGGALWYGITKEASRIVTPFDPKHVGMPVVNPVKRQVIARLTRTGWQDLPNGHMLIWRNHPGFTCDVLMTFRREPVQQAPGTMTIRDFVKPGKAPVWSRGSEWISDSKTQLDWLKEASFGFPIRIVVQRTSGYIDSAGNWREMPLPGESDPAPRWDIHYVRLLSSILLYLVPIWFAFGLFPRARRYLRRRQGCCVECAYSMKGLNTTTCSECGHVNRPITP